MPDPREGVAPDGTIRTGGALDRVPEEYAGLVAALVGEVDTAATGRREGSGPWSLLLYGSVANGTARPPGSDVDAFTIGLDPAVIEPVARRLTRQFDEACRGVELMATSAAAHEGESDEAYGNRVFLKHYCVVLAGADLARDWVPFPADARAARGLNGDIAISLDRWRSARADASVASALLGRKVARKTLLAVAGLVSVHDRTWTTDRTRAASRWAEVDAASSSRLEQLSAWSEGTAEATPSEVAEALSATGIVQHLSDAFAESIGLWQVG